MFRRCLLAVAFAVLAVSVWGRGGSSFGTPTPLPADDLTENQKKAVAANLKKAEIAKATVTETDHFIVAATLPEEKAAALGASLEKVYATARKALQFEEKEEPWKGKLAVYFLTDSKQYKLFVRSVLMEKPDSDSFVKLRQDDPMVVVSVEVTGKAADADLFGEAGAFVGAAVFQGKFGSTEFPAWVRTGFGRAAAYRAEGANSKRTQAYKARARTAALGGKGKGPAPITSVWDGTGDDVLATSLMDYIAFGPGQPNFLKFVNGFRPNENTPTPGVAQALEAAMWKQDQLDAAWKKWVASGK